MLQRDAWVGEGTDLEKTGIDPSEEGGLHSNILVATHDNLRALCDLAVGLNATMTAAGAPADGAEGRGGSDGAHAAATDQAHDEAWRHLGVAVRGGLQSASEQEGQCTFERPGQIGGELAHEVEQFGRERDNMALEVASCAVHAAPGDVLLIHPDVFHRTQDVAASRVALLVEAM